MSTNKEIGILLTSKEGRRFTRWAVDRVYLRGVPDYFLGKTITITSQDGWVITYKVDGKNFWHGIFVAYLAHINDLLVEEFVIPKNADHQCALCFPQTHHRISILNCIREGNTVQSDIKFPT